jgi:HAD superfamily hydrolase (TIGR01509 family)
MNSLHIQAVIFDMDGLVLDSESGYFAAWHEAADKMGLSLDPVFCASLSGAHGDWVSQRLLQHFGDNFDIQRFFQLSNACWRKRVKEQGIPVKAGFFVLLRLLRILGLPFCLATNSRRHDAEQALQWAGLSSVFPLLISRDDVDHPKPAPDLFLKAAANLNLPSQHCLVLEDSPIGVAAAVAAACPCVMVPSMPMVDEAVRQQARLVLADLAQVADFIAVELRHSV